MGGDANRLMMSTTIGGIRRGLCNRCGKTFTFLPAFSPPYGHYSFIARSQALQRYFLEGRCWEQAAPTVKDPDRVADSSTLRRWFRKLDKETEEAFATVRGFVSEDYFARGWALR